MGCVLAEVYSNKIYKFFNSEDAAEGIKAGDSLVLYVTEHPVHVRSECCTTIVHHRQKCGPAHLIIGVPSLCIMIKETTGRNLRESLELWVEHMFGDTAAGK